MINHGFRKVDERNAHDRWCDAMVNKARANYRKPIICGRSGQTAIIREPKYSNYELKKLLTY